MEWECCDEGYTIFSDIHAFKKCSHGLYSSISSAWFCELNSQLRQWFPLMYLILYACIFLFSHWKTFVILCRVLDNLKDYAVRALVNAVDHLGTVAYKLTDLLEQQTSDVSTMELRVSCMNQVNFPEWIWCYMISNK